MKTNVNLLSILLLAATACGDNKLEPDARVRPDTGSGSGSGFPAAPALGTQIDRMGRPAVNTLLNHGFDPSAAAAGSAKNAYNADTAFGSGWVNNYRVEFAKNIAVIDTLDTGICGNLRCEANEFSGIGNVPLTGVCEADCGSANVGSAGSGNGCGNSVIYNVGTGQTVPNQGSYIALGSLLAQDEIFLNTSKAACTTYLAVEYYVATGAPGTEGTCGGRTLEYDVVDFSLSMISAGLGGFNVSVGSAGPVFTPKIGDNTPKHMDYLADFPYLGNPH